VRRRRLAQLQPQAVALPAHLSAASRGKQHQEKLGGSRGKFSEPMHHTLATSTLPRVTEPRVGASESKYRPDHNGSPATNINGPPRQSMNHLMDLVDGTTARNAYTMRSFRSRCCTSFCSPGGACDSKLDREWRMLPFADRPGDSLHEPPSAFDSYTEQVPERCSAVCIPGSIATIYRRQSGRITHEKERTCPSAVFCPPCPMMCLCIPCCCRLPYLVTKDGSDVQGVTRQLCCVAGSCPVMPVFSVENAKGDRLYLLETRIDACCPGDVKCLSMHFSPISGPYDKATGG